MICLRVVTDCSDAERIQRRLKMAGIECHLRADLAGGTMPHLTLSRGIEIRVPEEQRAQALDLLQDGAG